MDKIATNRELMEAAAKAICCVQLNGGDPEQPAVRWNGAEMEPQEFPAWQDYIDEASHALSAIQILIPSGNKTPEAGQTSTNDPEREHLAGLLRGRIVELIYAGGAMRTALRSHSQNLGAHEIETWDEIVLAASSSADCSGQEET